MAFEGNTLADRLSELAEEYEPENVALYWSDSDIDGVSEYSEADPRLVSQPIFISDPWQLIVPYLQDAQTILAIERTCYSGYYAVAKHNAWFVSREDTINMILAQERNDGTALNTPEDILGAPALFWAHWKLAHDEKESILPYITLCADQLKPFFLGSMFQRNSDGSVTFGAKEIKNDVIACASMIVEKYYALCASLYKCRCAVKAAISPSTPECLSVYHSIYDYFKKPMCTMHDHRHIGKVRYHCPAYFGDLMLLVKQCSNILLACSRARTAETSNPSLEPCAKKRRLTIECAAPTRAHQQTAEASEMFYDVSMFQFKNVSF